MEVIPQFLPTGFPEYHLSTILITIISGTSENDNSGESVLPLESDSLGMESRHMNFKQSPWGFFMFE